MDAQQLSSAFGSAFAGAVPAGMCVAPGRVNLIGEHVDYSGLSVLPMAIDRGIAAAFTPRRDQTVRIANADDRFAPASFEASEAIPPAAPGDWSNYVRAAVQAIRVEMGLTVGMDVLFAADLPAAAGLSSSTALVVASALAYLSCGGKASIDDAGRKELADILAAGERYVGTQSGGMDHAAILLGQAGHALKIDFEPLRCEAVPIPEDLAVIVCNSGIVADKGGGSQASYNRGPAMCAVIRAMVERYAQSEFGDEIELPTLGEIWHGPLCLTHSEAADLFEGAIPKPEYSTKAIAAFLDMDADTVRDELLLGLEEPKGGFPLQAWARHQYQEHRRVERMRDALLCGDAEAAGQMLDESQASCANGLGVSTPELDALVETARASGAYGARLTGAGFGGCTVNLVGRDAIDTFCHAVWTRYFVDGGGKGAGFSAVEEAIFEVVPSAGAGYR